MESDLAPPSLSDDMKPILWILRLLTVTPFSIAKGRVLFSWRSWPMACAITSYIGMAIYAAYAFWVKYTDLFNESHTFSDAVFFLTFLVALTHHFFSPLIHWSEAQGLADYFDLWNDFQTEFHKATGLPFNFGLREASWRHFGLTLLVPVLLLIVSISVVKPLRVQELLPFTAVGMFHATMPRAWDMFGLAVVRAGECLREHFDAIISERDVKSIKTFRRLWTKLRRLAVAPGICWGMTSLHFLLYCLALLLMSAFGVMTALQQGSARGSQMFCVVVDILSHLLVLCTAAYASCETVETFLRIIQDSRKEMCLSGFLILDRKLFCAMVGVVVTYLCVLSQFGTAVSQLYDD